MDLVTWGPKEVNLKSEKMINGLLLVFILVILSLQRIFCLFLSISANISIFSPYTASVSCHIT